MKESSFYTMSLSYTYNDDFKLNALPILLWPDSKLSMHNHILVPK
jgi:hypothetical protein